MEQPLESVVPLTVPPIKNCQLQQGKALYSTDSIEIFIGPLPPCSLCAPLPVDTERFLKRSSQSKDMNEIFKTKKRVKVADDGFDALNTEVIIIDD